MKRAGKVAAVRKKKTRTFCIKKSSKSEKKGGEIM